MLNPISTIYQAGWLDLVFANRNKNYGAYELRRNYNKRLARALFITTAIVFMLFSLPFLKDRLFSPDDALVKPDRIKETIVTMSPVPMKKKVIPPAVRPQTQARNVRTTRFVEVVVVNHPVVENPPTIQQLQNSAVGPADIEGPALASMTNAGPADSAGGEGDGPAITSGDGNTPVSIELLEKNPEFPGGMEGFARYLRKNLRYPEAARDAGVSGKVFISFIVEKDGHLTDIKILKGIGFGCDQEATRVLKKSPVWTPGIQNKHEVRVLYTLPLTFQLGE